jgi:hypothetical protein
MQPRFPIYIPSKGRSQSRITARYLDQMGVPYRVIIEQQEHEAYAAVIDPGRLLILDPAYQRNFDACMTLREGQGPGSGPARNFAWDHSIAAGADWHWIMDDNIYGIYRLLRNSKIKCGDGTPFRVMEDFALRYTNVAMAGPNYEFFVPQRQKKLPYTLNSRIYSCNLIRNDVPFRWRCRYNEDTDLSLRMLKAGWCTILFNAFLQKKVWTQVMKGGNTSEFYAAEGTLPKSRMLASLHPDVTKVVWRYGRWHHHVDYSRFSRNKLARRADLELPDGHDDYGMRLIHLDEKSAA